MSIKGKFRKDEAGFGKILVTLAVVALLLIPAAAAQGELLFPLQLGGYQQYNAADGASHFWQARGWVVAENILLNGKTYFQIRRENWDPYETNPRGSEDNLMRSTDTQAWISVGGPEWLMFQTGDVGTNWTYTDPWGVFFCDIMSFGSLTVPAGTFNAYEERMRSVEGPEVYGLPNTFYLVPGHGQVKEVALNVDPSRIPRTHALSQTGYQGVSLMPLKTGNRFTYNARDNLGNTWQMRLEILGQVTMNGTTYFRGRQLNYDPIEQKTDQWVYIRCTANELYISFDGVTERLEFQIAGPGTAWNFPEDPGTMYKQINSIEPVNVLGGSFLAYKHQSQYIEGSFISPYFYDYVVPALGIARMEDHWVDGPGRAPLIFELVKMEEVKGALPALMLLLGK